MPIETFTEVTCTKCKKVHREEYSEYDAPGPTSWAEGNLYLYNRDREVKQQVDLDLCPSCTGETLAFLGVKRKRMRKAKVLTPEVDTVTVIDSLAQSMGTNDQPLTEQDIRDAVQELETKNPPESQPSAYYIPTGPLKPKRGRPRKQRLQEPRGVETNLVMGIVGDDVLEDAPDNCPWAEGPHWHTKSGICLAPKEQEKRPEATGHP